MNAKLTLQINSPWQVSEHLHLMLPEMPALSLVKTEQTWDLQVVERAPGVHGMCL